MKRGYLLVMAGGVLALQGCSNMRTMELKDMSAAPARTYEAPKAEVVEAARKSVAALYTLDSVKDGEPTTQIYFSKPVSAFSWGEVGRVDVTGLTARSTKVSLGSAKRSTYQFTGTTQDDFAKALFGKIDANLK